MTEHVYVPVMRFLDVDQQGVVFHMWYLAYFEDARNDMLDRQGLPLRQILADGYDIQVVHYEIDWSRPVGWGDRLSIRVRTAGIGTTSFSLDYRAVVDSEVRVHGRAVYVVISRGAGDKVAVPAALRRALDPLAAAM